MSSICHPTSESTQTARLVRENCMRPSCRTEAQKYVLLPNLFFLPHSIIRNRPRSYLSTTRHQNRPSSQRTTTRMRCERIATHVASSALPPMRLCHPPQASSGPWARRPSLYPLSSMPWWRWKAAAWVPPLAASGAGAPRRRLASGAHQARCNMRYCRTSSRAC